MGLQQPSVKYEVEYFVEVIGDLTSSAQIYVLNWGFYLPFKIVPWQSNLR